MPIQVVTWATTITSGEAMLTEPLTVCEFEVRRWSKRISGRTVRCSSVLTNGSSNDNILLAGFLSVIKPHALQAMDPSRAITTLAVSSMIDIFHDLDSAAIFLALSTCLEAMEHEAIKVDMLSRLIDSPLA
jgi:hypothetical protein